MESIFLPLQSLPNYRVSQLFQKRISALDDQAKPDQPAQERRGCRDRTVLTRHSNNAPIRQARLPPHLPSFLTATGGVTQCECECGSSVLYGLLCTLYGGILRTSSNTNSRLLSFGNALDLSKQHQHGAKCSHRMAVIVA